VSEQGPPDSGDPPGRGWDPPDPAWGPPAGGGPPGGPPPPREDPPAWRPSGGDEPPGEGTEGEPASPGSPDTEGGSEPPGSPGTEGGPVPGGGTGTEGGQAGWPPHQPPPAPPPYGSPPGGHQAPPYGSTPGGHQAPPYGQPPAGQYGSPQYGQPGRPPYGAAPYGYHVGHVAETNGKATTSLVLGIVGIVVCPIICSIPALVLGYQARTEIDDSHGRQTGRGNAVAGIVLGWIGVALYGVLFVIFLIAALVDGGTSGDYDEYPGLALAAAGLRPLLG
jgi:hypothetical protein